MTRRHTKLIPIVERAIELTGGSPKNLADQLRIKTPQLYTWDEVPAKHVLKMEAATGNRLTRGEIRPDLYPSSPPPVSAEQVRQIVREEFARAMATHTAAMRRSLARMFDQFRSSTGRKS